MAVALDLTGKWTLSRALSDDTEELLLLQGFGYFLRKAARLGTVILLFTHDTKASPPLLHVTVVPPAGFAKESRERKIDGEKVEDKHFMFGTNHVTWNPKTKKDELDSYFTEEEWITDDLLEEIIEDGNGNFTNYGVSFQVLFG
jgi:hypothetical protein